MSSVQGGLSEHSEFSELYYCFKTSGETNHNLHYMSLSIVVINGFASANITTKQSHKLRVQSPNKFKVLIQSSNSAKTHLFVALPGQQSLSESIDRLIQNPTLLFTPHQELHDVPSLPDAERSRSVRWSAGQFCLRVLANSHLFLRNDLLDTLDQS